MTRSIQAVIVGLAALAPLAASPVRVDLSNERVGRPPTAFEPMVGTWLVAEDAGEKVVVVDGRSWVASKDNPTRLLIGRARRLYGTSNEELMDNAKQFAYYPIALARSVPTFSNGALSVKFKTVSGDADRTAGLVFNVKPNGDWLALRYSDSENNLGLWEFHNGVRRLLLFSDSTELKLTVDRNAYHELKVEVNGPTVTGSLDGVVALTYELGSQPRPTRDGSPPNPDLLPANNPVLRPPVNGRVGLWAKTDATSYFKDFVVEQK